MADIASQTQFSNDFRLNPHSASGLRAHRVSRIGYSDVGGNSRQVILFSIQQSFSDHYCSHASRK